MSSDPAHSIDPQAQADLAATPHARRMLDRYEIIAEIAKGGMGTVYLSRLEGAGGFERLMALKLMHEHLADDDQFVAMLLDEARTAANIHHPNAVGIVDICESKVGHYLVMNYVEGFSLWQVMTHPDLGERERIRLSTRLIADALHGLHAAHTAKNAKGERLGIVHRDVSPQNVLVGTDGLGRIIDFGIALAASRIAASRPGVLKGKPSYMAPEQARGEPCDGRTDIFSMGIVLWEALVHQRLFWAEMDMAVLVQVMDCEIDRPDVRNPRVPAPLADVAMKALAASPADRYASAREFATALEKAADSVELLATTHEVEETLGRILSEEIAEKHAAVVQHLSASSGEPRALQKGQLGTVPRLVSKKPSFRDLPTRGAASGVRPRSSSTDAGRARHEAAIAPTATATPIPPVTNASVALPTRSSAPIAIGVAIAVAAAAGAYAWFSRSNESATAAETTASHAPGTSEAAPTTPAAAVAPTAPVVAAPAVAAPVAAAPVAADPPVVDPAAVGAATDPAAEQAPSPARAHPSSAEPTADEGASARRRPHASTPSPATPASPAPAAPPAEDEVEANPYVVR